jgi:hypothetical protein
MASVGERMGEQLDLQLEDVSHRAVEAYQVTAQRSAVGQARGRTVTLEQSALGGALARDVELRNGAAGLLGGGKVVVERSVTQWLVGGLVQAKQVFAVTVIAGRVEGQVKCLFDTRGAFAFGAGMALVGGLLRLLLFRRR